MKSNIKIWEAYHNNDIKTICKFDTRIGYYDLTIQRQNLISRHNAWKDKINSTASRDEWIQSLVGNFNYVVQRSMVELVDNSGGSLDNYYSSFINTSERCKLVACGPGESWYGDFIKDGTPYFLVFMRSEIKIDTDRNSRKPKRIISPSGLYYLACIGNDDFGMYKRNLTLDVAKELYELIPDGISQKELSDFGIVSE